MEINIFIMGGANAERLRETIADLREGGVTSRERRLITIRQQYAREAPTMVQLQFLTLQDPTPQYFLPSDIPSTSQCATCITVPSDFDATMLVGCRARLSFGPDPGSRPLFREVVLEIPDIGVNHREIVAFRGTGLPAVNTYVETTLRRYGGD
jgi:hypothetical protein